MSIPEIRFLSTNWKGPQFLLSESVEMCHPFDPHFHLRYTLWVFKCQTYSCWVSFFDLCHSSRYILWNSQIYPLTLGHFMSFLWRFDTPVRIKIHPVDTLVWVKRPMDPSPLLPVSGQRALTWLQGSSHNLLKQRGRLSRPINLRGERVGKFCSLNEIDDEMNFFSKCTFHDCEHYQMSISGWMQQWRVNLYSTAANLCAHWEL